MSVVSPELALIDPELALTARAALPLPGDCLAPSSRLPRREAPPAEVRQAPRRPSLIVAVVALLASSLIGLPSASAGIGTLAHLLHQTGAAVIR